MCPAALLRAEKEQSVPYVALQLPEGGGGGPGCSSTGRVVEFVPSVAKLQEVAASAAADEERAGINETSHVDVYMCASAMLTVRTALGVVGVRLRDIVSVAHSADVAMAAAARAVAAFTCRLGPAPAPVGTTLCRHSQPCTCNWHDLHSSAHRPSIWCAIAPDGEDAAAAARGVRNDGGSGADDFELQVSCGASEIMEAAGDAVAAALLAATARCCSCTPALVGRQRWRAIRRRIWVGQRGASARAAVDAVAEGKEAKAAAAKIHWAATAAEKKAAAKAAQAADAASLKAAAAAVAAAEKGENSCAESSEDENARWWQSSDPTSERVSDDSDDGLQSPSALASTLRLQKSVAKGAGKKALEMLKQRFLALPRCSDAAAPSNRREQGHFSLAAAAAYLQQCTPAAAAAIKARSERMSEIHRQAKQERDADGSPRLQLQQDYKRNDAAAAAAAAPVSKSAARPAPPIPATKHPKPPPPHLAIDASVVLSAAALEFFARVSSPQDVRCLVSDAALFAARHVRAYHKIWAAWESQRLVEQLQAELRQHVPLLPDAGVAAAAAAATAVTAWPWWMPRLDVSAFVERSVVAAVPAAAEVKAPAAALHKISPSKKKKSPKKAASPQSAAAVTVTVVTAQGLAEAVAERVLRMPLWHDMRGMMEETILEQGAALAASKAADERAEAAMKAASRAPPVHKEVLNDAAAAAQEHASQCRSALQKIHLPPLLEFASGRSTLHMLLSLRDGRALPREEAKCSAASSLVELQKESLKALLHPELAASPHLAPFSFCENSSDPSWLAEAPVSWILAMSGAVSGQQLQSIHVKFVSQWRKFADEALRSPVPEKVGLSDVSNAQQWQNRLAALRELHGASSIPKPDALTVSFAHRLKCMQLLNRIDNSALFRLR